MLFVMSTIVALDLGHTRIRGMEAQLRKNGLPKILKVHSIPIESGIIESGEIKNKELLSDAIKQLFLEAKFVSKDIVVISTGNTYETRFITKDVPWMKPEDFKKALPHIIGKTTVIEVADYFFDSHTLNEYYSTDEDDFTLYKEILVTGATREHTNKLISIIEKLGKRPVGLEVLPLPLIRAYSVLNTPPMSASIVSIELGGDTTTISIHKDLQPIYINTTTPLGGSRITHTLAKELGVSTAEAEMIKRAFSLPKEAQENVSTTVTEADGSVETYKFKSYSEDVIYMAYEILNREVSQLIGHIEEIVEDAFSARTDAPFEIILSGGGANLYSLATRIQSQLSIPTKVLQIFDENSSEHRIDEHVINEQESYATLYGLLVGRHE